MSTSLHQSSQYCNYMNSESAFRKPKLKCNIYFHRNWKYEQELASLLWKIDYKDLTIDYADPCTMVNLVLCKVL